MRSITAGWNECRAGKERFLSRRLDLGGANSGERERSMRALRCDCGQYLKADDKEALFREVRAHLKREDRPREHPLGRFLEEEQVRELVSERSYALENAPMIYGEDDDGSDEGLESLFFDYAESMRAVVLGTRAG